MTVRAGMSCVPVVNRLLKDQTCSTRRNAGASSVICQGEVMTDGRQRCILSSDVAVGRWCGSSPVCPSTGCAGR